MHHYYLTDFSFELPVIRFLLKLNGENPLAKPGSHFWGRAKKGVPGEGVKGS